MHMDTGQHPYLACSQPLFPTVIQVVNEGLISTAGILDALHIKKAHIVGHDWGSALAWAFAAIFPERTLQLVAISVGHPSNYFKGDHRGDQKKKSWYSQF